MNRTATLLTATALAALTLASAAWAQQAPRPEQLIKWRQSAYQVIGWNSGRIKASLDGTYNKDEVLKAATAIAAIANSGLGSLFAAGTETGKGWHDTTVKPTLFTNGARAAELAGAFGKEANELVAAAQGGDANAVKAQYARLTRTCKSCHDDFRNSN